MSKVCDIARKGITEGEASENGGWEGELPNSSRPGRSRFCTSRVFRWNLHDDSTLGDDDIQQLVFQRRLDETPGERLGRCLSRFNLRITHGRRRKLAGK